MTFARDILIGLLTALAIGAVLLWADVGQAQETVTGGDSFGTLGDLTIAVTIAVGGLICLQSWRVR